MKKLTILAAAASLVLSAGTAQALGFPEGLLAGWDISQYNPGNLNIGGVRTTSVGSNYSDLDKQQSFGLGNGSTDKGRFYVNGQFGSSNVGTGTPYVRATSGEILLNQYTGPISNRLMSDVSYGNALTAIEFPPSQPSFQQVRLVFGTEPVGQANTSVVFSVDLTAFAGSFDNVSISAAGRTNSSTRNIAVEFSPDGSSYSPLTTWGLSSTPQVFAAATNLLGLSKGYFRLTTDGDTTISPTIDNVQIRGQNVSYIPEPGTALLLVSGLAGLALAGRRRA